MTKTLVFTQYGGPENQELNDRELPEPGPKQIAIKVKAAGVNPADAKIRAGLMGDHWSLPAPMGREASGIVTALGSEVEDFAVGDAVTGLVAKGNGAFAEATLLRASQTVAKPEELTFVDAAALPVAGGTAYDVTHQIELEPGQTMLILGAGGGVGLIAAQIGRVHEFSVIGVASAAKRPLIESTGATFVESGSGAAERVRTIAPEGVDLVIDLVGGQALREIAEAASDPGRIVSTADPDTAAELGGAGVQRTKEGLAKIVEVAEYGLIDAMVAGTYPLAEVEQAIAIVEDGHAGGKIVVVP